MKRLVSAYKPWQRVTIRCEMCDATATRRVVATGEDDVVIGPEGPRIMLGSNPLPEVDALLVCDAHNDAAVHRVMTSADGALGVPLRPSWRNWFLLETRVGEPFRWLGNAVSDWRWERGLQGKMFGYRLQSFPLDDDEEQG